MLGLSLLLAVTGCPVAGMHRPAVDFTASAAPAAVRTGDTLRLVARLRNPSDAPLVMEFATSCPVHFYVQGGDRRILEPEGGTWRCTAVQTRVALAPGEQREYRHVWPVRAGSAPDTLTVYSILEDHHLVKGGDREFKAGHRSNEVAVVRAP